MHRRVLPQVRKLELLAEGFEVHNATYVAADANRNATTTPSPPARVTALSGSRKPQRLSPPWSILQNMVAVPRPRLGVENECPHSYTGMVNVSFAGESGYSSN
jgi:hypothetical protein